MSEVRLVLCPLCKKQTAYSASNPFRPFCSERCKLIDLGEWASGNYAVPSDDVEPIDSPEEETDLDLVRRQKLKIKTTKS